MLKAYEGSSNMAAASRIFREKTAQASQGAVSAGKRLTGVLLLVLGLACLAYVVVQLANDLSLWLWGKQVEAEVVEMWADPVGEAQDGVLSFEYFVRYQFVTPDGQVVTGMAQVGPGEWAGLGSGAKHYPRGIGSSPPAAAGSQNAPIYHEQATVPQSSFGGMDVGGSVAVVYYPRYPEHNRLEESRLIPVLACAYVPLTMASLGALFVGWRFIRGERY